MSERPTAERSRGALFLLVAIFAAAALWFVIGSEDSAAPVVRGAKAPAFSLSRWRPGSEASNSGSPDSADRSAPVDLASLAGRIVLVNFWATWCEPCEQELPAMQRLYSRLPRDRFELVAISIDEEPEKIGEFVERYALSFPIATDPTKRVAGAYQTMGVPESLLVDSTGRIVERYVGPREWDAPEYVARIEALYAGGGSGGAAASGAPTVAAESASNAAP